MRKGTKRKGYKGNEEEAKDRLLRRKNVKMGLVKEVGDTREALRRL